MRISLVGMSGSGKTLWAKKLEKKGFKRFACEDILEEKLEHELKKLGYKGVQDVAKWMGQPYDKQYAKTSSQYLMAERETMEEVLSYIEKKTKPSDNILIDTTGSVIYNGGDILERLKKSTTVVFLDTPSRVQKAMYLLYLSDPKPVIWGDAFRRLKGETKEAALARCYPQLLEFRLKKYKSIADVTLDYYSIRSPQFSEKDFISAIKSSGKNILFSFF